MYHCFVNDLSFVLFVVVVGTGLF